MHGPFGEDGKIQGMFEYLGIPYSGSGILPSAIGIDKSVQKQLMVNAGFNSPKFFTIDREKFINGNCGEELNKAKKEIGFPLVVKPANQGSSIGISILHNDENYALMGAVGKALFTEWVDVEAWKKLSDEEKFS